MHTYENKLLTVKTHGWALVGPLAALHHRKGLGSNELQGPGRQMFHLRSGTSPVGCLDPSSHQDRVGCFLFFLCMSVMCRSFLVKNMANVRSLGFSASDLLALFMLSLFTHDGEIYQGV